MPSFVISTATIAAQSLANSETGYLTDDGAIVNVGGPAVTMTGAARLINNGELGSFASSAVFFNGVSSGTLTQGSTGSIIGGGLSSAAILGSFTSTTVLRNAGEIIGGKGIEMSTTSASAKLQIVNSGQIEALGGSLTQAISLTMVTGATANLSNSGTIQSSGGGNTIEVKTGGSLFLTNTGSILTGTGFVGLAVSAAGALTMVNDGLIVGNVSAGGPTGLAANITNTGDIVGSIFVFSGSDRVTIIGQVSGDVVLGEGANIFVLKGGSVNGVVRGGTGSDQYFVDRSNIAILDAGGTDAITSTVSIALSGGVENLNLVGVGLTGIGTSSANVMVGGDDSALFGKAGNDLLVGGLEGADLFGGSGDDTLEDTNEADLMEGGRGNDVFETGRGEDTIVGGAGIDTLLLLVRADNGFVVNLSTGVIDGGENDLGSITGIENVTGSFFFNDTLTGNAQANALSGSNGADVLSGASGNDTLNGGGGSDLMTGGGGIDFFAYAFAEESDGVAALDRIVGFQTADVIDLSGLDAIPGGSNDAFVFIGTGAFTGAVGEIRFVKDIGAGTTLVEARFGGSVVDDMQILLATAMDLTGSNFIL